MNFVIVSDLHLGSRYFYCDEFIKFIRGIPKEFTLILNGDVVSYWHKTLPAEHEKVLDLLAEQSFKRPVIWVRGNHDSRYNAVNPGRIEFVNEYVIGQSLYVSHGYDFDDVMPHNRTFLMLFRLIHRIRILLGAQPIHVAFYAKRWPSFYRVLRQHVTRNAVKYAKEHGFSTVICGHTHHVDDITVDGIRYINTGSWTEPPLSFLKVTDNSMELISVAGKKV